jgi:hypothetical protein
MLLRKSLLPFVAFIAVFLTIYMYSLAFADEGGQSWEDRYKSEPYIVLLDEGSIKVNPDYSVTTTSHIIKKIQQEGGKKEGEIRVTYDQKREEVTALEAYTIMPDGTKLPYEKIQELNDSQDSVYSDTRTKVITMPNVVVGSILDYKVTTVLKKPIIENNFYGMFRISSSCPIKESHSELTAPKSMKLNIKYMNTEIKPKVLTSGDDVTYVWTASNVDKDEAEESMPSHEEMFKAVAISTLNSWEQFSAWAWSLYEKNIKLSTEMKEKVKEVTAGKKTTPEKVQAIIQYIQDNFRYVSMNMDAHGYEPHPSDKIFSNKYGDCKDQTLLAVALLSQIGVKARPVFLSSQLILDRQDLIPMPTYFDHATLSLDLDGKKYYTDVLLKGYPFEKIPTTLAGRGAVIIAPGQGGGFVSIPLSDSNDITTISHSKVLINADATAAVDLTLTFPRTASSMFRESLKEQSNEKKEKLLARIGKSMSSGGTVTKFGLRNEDVPYSQMSIDVQCDDPTAVQQVGDLMLFGLPQVKRGTNFSAKQRLYPIVTYQDSRIESLADYSIPDGYEIVSVPKNVSEDSPFVTYTRTYNKSGNKVTGEEIFLYKKSRIAAADYKSVQGFFDRLPKLTNDKIVIKKKAVL